MRTEFVVTSYVKIQIFMRLRFWYVFTSVEYSVAPMHVNVRCRTIRFGSLLGHTFFFQGNFNHVTRNFQKKFFL